MKNTSSSFKTDIQSGLVVFLVALPLCLGIALASGAPLFAGIIAGVVGGIVIGLLSDSQLSVSGPAAGLTAIVLAAITSLGSYEAFLAAVVIGGLFQILLGVARAGAISNYFPSNVIEGMLTAIGVIIILKQLPHAVGYDVDNEGDFFFIEKGTGHNTFSALIDAVNYSHPGAIIVTVVSLTILIAFIKVPLLKRIKVVPGALVAVISGVALNTWWSASGSSLAIGRDHLVNLPVPADFNAFFAQFTTPEVSAFLRPEVWIVGATLAVVASIETLLCVEAADKLDTQKRFTNTDRELYAQGAGNLISGLIGGLPMTSVIVRTSANINAGAQTKTSTIAHGLFLLLAVVTIPFVLNQIPLACLAAVLLQTGFKLASPRVFRHMWSNGRLQFIPFFVTVIAVVFTDLLRGVAVGLVVSVFYILRANMRLSYFFSREQYNAGEKIVMRLAQEVSFLNKAAIKKTLREIPRGAAIEIDASETAYIDHDVLNLIRDFVSSTSVEKEISVTLTGFREHYSIAQSLPHVTIQ
ncbi:MAG: SulP family inorganic anion transporter [Sphingobacteriales bacterium]|nr:SulP family inorganic anion transporter [Sphingobacteriales bacterium]